MGDNVNILIGVSSYHEGEGLSRHCAELARALRDRGHAITVLTRGAATSTEDVGISFLDYRVPSWGLLSLLILEPWIVSRELKRSSGPFDVVVLVGLTAVHPAVVIGFGTHHGQFEFVRRVRPWWTVRGAVERIRPSHRIVMAWERRMLRHGSVPLAVVGAEYFRRDYIDHFGFTPERVVAIPLAVNSERFAFDGALRHQLRTELGIPEGTTVLLDIAGRVFQKGLDRLVDALALLPEDRNWHCVIAGDGSVSPSLVRRAQPILDRGRLTLLGRVPDVHALYCAADVLVAPGRLEPWGMTLTESLACGLPVVSTATVGASAVVRQGETGEIVDGDADATDLAAAILRILDSDLPDRSRVRATVKELTWERYAEDFEGCLARLALS